MRKNRIVSLVGLLAAIVLPLVQPISAFAWGPERPTYTMKNPADHPTFNSITDNPVLGDERDFVRIVEKKADGEAKDTYVSDLEIEAGKDYEVYIGYHNNASETLNDKAHNRQGVAWNVKVATNFPSALTAGQKGEIQAKISSTSTTPEAVWDEAYVTAKQDVTLHYLMGSAKIYNGFAANGSTLSRNIFSKDGTFLGMDELNGMIYGCSAYSGHVVYTIRVITDGEPVPDDVEDPTPEEEKPVTPVLPSELPKTGPMEITVVAVVAALAIAALAYAIHTRRAARKAAKSRKNKTNKKK